MLSKNLFLAERRRGEGYRRRRPNTGWGGREFDGWTDHFDFPACGVADCFYCFSGLDLGVFQGCLDVAIVSLTHKCMQSPMNSWVPRNIQTRVGKGVSAIVTRGC